MKRINRLREKAAFVAAAAFIPTLAHAQDLAPVNTFADTIVAFLTGPFAIAAGTIAIAVVGYRWFTGRLELGRALTIAGGIVLVLGAPQIVQFVSDGI